jgi:RimJ/RimL family protein N-acetyltransferase
MGYVRIYHVGNLATTSPEYLVSKSFIIYYLGHLGYAAVMRLELSKSVIRSLELTDAPAIATHGILRGVLPDPFSIEATNAFLRGIIGAVPEQWFAIEVHRQVVGIEVYRRVVGAFHVSMPPGPEQSSAHISYSLAERYHNRGIVNEALHALSKYLSASQNVKRTVCFHFEAD